MDLLLHLVHQQEVPIEKVQMSVIAEQYLEIVLNPARALDLDKAGEYLVIAATLLAIKSRSLLPGLTQGEEEKLDTDWFDARFFEDLRARIRAYEVTKCRAQALIKLPQLGVDTFVRTDRQLLKPTPEMLAEPEDVYSLGVLFGRLIRRVGGLTSSFRIALEPVSVVSVMMRIVDSFTGIWKSSGEPGAPEQPKNLRDILHSFIPEEVVRGLHAASSRESALSQVRGALIGSFIAVLELTKRGVLSLREQGEGLDAAVSLRLSADAVGLGDGVFISEFDLPESEQAQGALDDEQTAPAPGPAKPGKVVQMSDYRAQEAERRLKETAAEQNGLSSGDAAAEAGKKMREAGNV